MLCLIHFKKNERPHDVGHGQDAVRFAAPTAPAVVSSSPRAQKDDWDSQNPNPSCQICSVHLGFCPTMNLRMLNNLRMRIQIIRTIKKDLLGSQRRMECEPKPESEYCILHRPGRSGWWQPIVGHQWTHKFSYVEYQAINFLLTTQLSLKTKLHPVPQTPGTLLPLSSVLLFLGHM